MPLYDMFCPECGEEYEDVVILLQDLDKPVPCGNCDTNMKRKCGNAGFKLKGDGWGEDGYDKYIGDINKTRKANGQPELTYDDIHGTNHLGDK